MGKLIEGVCITPLSIIKTDGGDVLHGMKVTDQGCFGFGEAYFSIIEPGAIKGWKLHKEMVLNLIVPVGSVRFILYDSRNNYCSYKQFQEVELSKKNNYSRLTVPPMIWMGFQGTDKNSSLILNIANKEHSQEEVDRMDLDEIKYNWNKV